MPVLLLAVLQAGVTGGCMATPSLTAAEKPASATFWAGAGAGDSLGLSSRSQPARPFPTCTVTHAVGSPAPLCGNPGVVQLQA
jgi:hypothetical protein